MLYAQKPFSEELELKTYYYLLSTYYLPTITYYIFDRNFILHNIAAHDLSSKTISRGAKN